MRKLKILFVDAAVNISISDSARGYLNALKRAGHDVYHFNTTARIAYNAVALKNGPQPDMAENFPLTSRLASEGIVVEALRQRSDLVVIASGLALHPDGLELLNRTGQFPTALILTESPYDDERQRTFSRHAGHVFTNDRYSARENGWHYLASAYDPEFHHPYEFDRDQACDVLFVGTGWPERTKLLEGVDWTGINLKILGIWPDIKDDSPLAPYYTKDAVSNDETARLYSSARVTINHHRHHPLAESLSPRGFELGGCGAFQVSDWRPELDEAYRGTVPVYDGSADLERIVRHHLDDGSWLTLTSLRSKQREALQLGHHTFDDRVVQMMDVLSGVRV